MLITIICAWGIRGMIKPSSWPDFPRVLLYAALGGEHQVHKTALRLLSLFTGDFMSRLFSFLDI